MKNPVTAKENYHRLMLSEISEIRKTGAVPRLLLHACCAPCSSRALTLLSEVFDLTVFFFNPNIYPREEYELRLREQRRFLAELPLARPVFLEAPEYCHSEFSEVVRGAESEPEGSGRCRRCFELRLGRTAETAKGGGFDYFATTLTVGPRKAADVINPLGLAIGGASGVRFLVSDMKKQDGYLLSIRLSEQYRLYRQKYCGCEYSFIVKSDS